jgi:hypothetical protein
VYFPYYVLLAHYIIGAKLLLKLFWGPRSANTFLHGRMRPVGHILVNPALMYVHHYYIKLIFSVYSSMIVFMSLAATVLTVFLVLTCYRIFVAVFWWEHDRDVFVNGKNVWFIKS